MARPIRIEYPGAIYHIISRGNNRGTIYIDDDDKKEFLNILENVINRYQLQCYAYCLMDNHYHLLIETQLSNLSISMRQLNGNYANHFNKRHKKVGHCFQSRFKGILVERDSYLLELCRYIVLNPVRAGMVNTPEEYKWSSFLATIDEKATTSFLNYKWIRSQFSNNNPIEEYKKFVFSALKSDSSFNQLKANVILGSDSFIKSINEKISERKNDIEIPLEQRMLNRLTIDEAFDCPTKVLNKTIRNNLLKHLHFSSGYTITEIAKRLGLHYTTVSKIINDNS